MIEKDRFFELKEFMGAGYIVEVKFVGSDKDDRLSADIHKCQLKKTRAFLVSANSYDRVIIATEDCVKDSELKNYHHPFDCRLRVSTKSLEVVGTIKKRKRGGCICQCQKD